MNEMYFNMQKDKKLFSDLSDVLSEGEVFTKRNQTIDGDIRIKRGGLNEGLIHLIDHRIRERVLNKKEKMDLEKAKIETTAVLFLVINNIDKAPAIKEANGHYAVYHEGIKTVIGKDKKGRYVVTGYDNNQTKKEATESINAVIARYGQSPEFLGIYAQVGAVIASYEILPHSSEKSTPIPSTPSKSLEDMVYKGAAVTIGNKKIKCRHGLLEEFRKNYHLLEAEREKTKSLTEQVAELKKQVVEQKEISRISRQVSRNDDFEMEY